MATQVANTGMVIGAAFISILELEKEVSRLWHHVSILSKRLKGWEEEKRVEEKDEVGEVVAEVVVETEVAAVGAPPITSGVHEVVAEEEDVAGEILAGVESMSVGLEVDEDEVVDGKIVVRLRGDKKRRITEVGGGEKGRG